ncbi:MAG: hypothetical protein HY916_00090 [Desulfovibrio sp.]|jgi:hypothetical protein|nr:hypothetical protein [Desulfovibrio sp.]
MDNGPDNTTADTKGSAAGQSGWRQKAGNLWQRLRLRRREPWNWLAQNFFAAFLPPGLLFHSWPLCALSLIGFAASCRSLPLPPMEHTGAKWLVPHIERLIGLESAWLAAPMTPRKKRQLWFLGIGAPLTAIMLWRQDLGPIGLAIAAFALWRVRRKNIEQGIDP